MRILTSSSLRNPGASAKPADLFERCREFRRPQEFRDAGLYMYFEPFNDRSGCGPGEIRLRDRRVLMFGSNDYLDLITHPKVVEAAGKALRRYGAGCSGSRLLNGTLDLHVEVESKLAALVHKEAAIIFGTGFQANYAGVSALTEKGDALICDHNLHASCVEGALRSSARTIRFRHNDMDHLERCLQVCSQEPVLIVSEGVFSMEGDLADIPGIVKLAKRYHARVYIDEAHGIGVLGPTGAGTAEHFGLLDDVDIVMGTFSKSLASVGGFLASEESVISYLKHTARPFVFSASLPAASVAAVGAALDIMREEPERQQHLLRIAGFLRRELRLAGFDVLESITPIVPVVIPNEVELCRLCKSLLADGDIYVNPVLRPAASQNLLRISCTAAHTEAHVTRLVETLVELHRRLGAELTAAASAD